MKPFSDFKRCKCRDADGREIGATCPQLKRAGNTWNPSHGTWYGKAEVPGMASREFLRAGGFATQTELRDWYTEALRLLGIPEAGKDGREARGAILSLIRESRRLKAALPDYDDMRRRYQDGVEFRAGSTGDYLLSWLKIHKPTDDPDDTMWAETTYLSYSRAVERLFLPAFGEVPLDKLRTSHVTRVTDLIDAENARIIAARTSDDPQVRAPVAGRRTAGPASKQRYIAVLKSALSEAMARKLITSNPADFHGGRKSTKKRTSVTRARLWTAERVERWQENYDARLAGRQRVSTAAERFAEWRRTSERPGPVMIWTPDHLGQFLDYAMEVPARKPGHQPAQDRMYPALHLIAHCGLRRGEACGLHWEETDLGAGSISISDQITQVGWKTIHSRPKTSRSEGIVRLDGETARVLAAWRKEQLAERMEWGPAWENNGLVFTREDGSEYHPAYITSRFERLSFAAGLPPIRLHDLRHGAATLALAGGADITAVSAMLRHSSIHITAEIYAEVLPELAAETAAKVAAMIPRKGRAWLRSVPDGLPTVSRGRT